MSTGYDVGPSSVVQGPSGTESSAVLGDRRVRFALLGCGKIAQKHAAILKKMSNAELAAVCDVDIARAEAFAREYGVPSFGSLRALVDAVPIDVVTITTPSGMHYDHTILAAELGVSNIVVEKPMALKLEHGDAMLERCSARGSRLFVVKQNRYNRVLKELHSAIHAGRFGQLISVSAQVRWSRNDEYYSSAAWRGTWAMDGGVLANQAIHHIDLLQWLVGEVETVFAFGTNRRARIEAEDTAACVLRFANGALATLEASTAVRSEDSDASLTVLGDGGNAVVCGAGLDRLGKWAFASKHPADEIVVRECCEPAVAGRAHEAYLEDVVACVLENRPAPVDGVQGLRALRTLSAMYESMMTGRAVHLASAHPRRSPLGRAPTRGRKYLETVFSAHPTLRDRTLKGA